MSYRVHPTRRADGGYDLAYGKGKGKLTARLFHDCLSGWRTADGVCFHRKADAIAAWESWAKDHYGKSAFNAACDARDPEAADAALAGKPDAPPPADPVAEFKPVTGYQRGLADAARLVISIQAMHWTPHVLAEKIIQLQDGDKVAHA